MKKIFIIILIFLFLIILKVTIEPFSNFFQFKDVNNIQQINTDYLKHLFASRNISNMKNVRYSGIMIPKVRTVISKIDETIPTEILHRSTRPPIREPEDLNINLKEIQPKYMYETDIDTFEKISRDSHDETKMYLFKGSGNIMFDNTTVTYQQNQGEDIHVWLNNFECNNFVENMQIHKLPPIITGNVTFNNFMEDYNFNITDELKDSNITTPDSNITTPSSNITTPDSNRTTPDSNITTPSSNITTPSSNITTPDSNRTTQDSNRTTDFPIPIVKNIAFIKTNCIETIFNQIISHIHTIEGSLIIQNNIKLKGYLEGNNFAEALDQIQKNSINKKQLLNQFHRWFDNLKIYKFLKLYGN